LGVWEKMRLCCCLTMQQRKSLQEGCFKVLL
jgi:hypothetical protein